MSESRGDVGIIFRDKGRTDPILLAVGVGAGTLGGGGARKRAFVYICMRHAKFRSVFHEGV